MKVVMYLFPLKFLQQTQKPFNIHVEAILQEQGNSFICYSKQSAIGLQLQYSGSVSVYLYGNDGNTQMLSTDNLPIIPEARYIFDVGYNEEEGFYVKASCNNQTVEDSKNIGDIWIREDVTEFFYGRCSYSYDCKFEVDLLHSYFEVENSKIRPLMQIPYVQSHSGSKIVDAEYRGFVQELYEKMVQQIILLLTKQIRISLYQWVKYTECLIILHLLQTKNLVIIKLFNF